MRQNMILVTVLLILGHGTPAGALDLDKYRVVDLSYPYNNKTLYWPTAPHRFKFEQLHHGETAGGFFYSAYRFATPEHGGTHMDAPVHFHATGNTVDQVPLQQLILPGVVIDISAAAAKDRDYRLRVDDVIAFEKQHGRIHSGTAVLVRTGWDRFWPDAKTYLGDDTPGDASRLSFPGFGAAATRLLIEQRKAALIGIDTASTDYGQSKKFIVHRIAARNNVPGIENLTGLDKLPATGFTLVALPMKIEGGSGGPVRAIGLVKKP